MFAWAMSIGPHMGFELPAGELSERKADMGDEIKLTQNKVAIVDAADFEWLSQWKWHATCRRGKWYARRGVKMPNGTVRTFMMHREILGVSPGVFVDHKDDNGLNNQRSNLRPATHQQNNWNRGLIPANTSGYIGVSWDSANKKWRAAIRRDGKVRFLGEYTDIVEAAKRYNEVALELRGEFARLNDVSG